MGRGKDLRLELVVLFMREFSWGWEYAKKTIGEMPLWDLNELVAELAFQRSLDAYERVHNTASIMATIVNMTWRGKGAKRATVKEMMGLPPRRSGEASVKTLREAAEEIGIRIPEGGT